MSDNRSPARSRFTYAPEQLQGFAQEVLDAARRAGASACECEVSEGRGLSVTVRKDEPETIEHNLDKGIGITASRCISASGRMRAAAMPARRIFPPRR